MEIPRIGIPRIDEQHEGLVKALEDLRKWNGTAYESSAVFGAVAFMEHYARTHFADEEELLRKAGFEKAEEIVKAAKPVDTVDAHLRGKRSFCLYQANSGEWIAECLREGADGEFRAVTGSGDTAIEAVNDLDKKFGR